MMYFLAKFSYYPYHLNTILFKISSLKFVNFAHSPRQSSCN